MKLNDNSLINWLDDSSCPKCKGFNYEEQDIEHDSSTEHFRRWDCSCGASWQERYNLTKVYFDGQEQEIESELEENLAYENKQMGDFLESLGLSVEDISNLVINGDKQQQQKALNKVKQVPVIYTNRINAQGIIDLLNDKLWHSDTSFTHDSDKDRVFIEVGNDVDDNEFKTAYNTLKELLGIKEFSSSYMLVDY